MAGRKMRVYLSGPMTGKPDLNRKAFNEAADELRKLGHEVFNPAAANLEGWPLKKILQYEANWIFDEAEAIALLPGWSMSAGASMELTIARAIGLEVIPLSHR